MPEAKAGQSRIIHGVLMEIFDWGTLILGESGTGKSEAALELIDRGHRLVADDSVLVKENSSGLNGTAPTLTKGVLALRGLPLIQVIKSFGGKAFIDEVNIQICIEFSRNGRPDVLGHFELETESIEFFKLQVPLIRIDASTHRPTGILVETAVRAFADGTGNEIAREIAERHDSSISPR